jgi:hypothetical protein
MPCQVSLQCQFYIGLGRIRPRMALGIRQEPEGMKTLWDGLSWGSIRLR